MAWQTIIDASSLEEAKTAKPTIADIPAGSRVKIRVEFAWYAPIGKIGDLAGAELWYPKLLPYDLEVIDVYGDWHWIEILGTAKGFPVLPVVIAISASIAALGIAFFVTRFLMQAEITEQAEIQAEREERRFEYVRWRTSPEGGSATPELAWQEVTKGTPPEPVKEEAKSLFPDLFPEVGMGLVIVVLIVLLLLSRR
jgi:hypothetical protein